VEERFGNIVRDLLPHVEVHVMAANGLETTDQWELIRKLSEADGYEFDKIILVYNLNDIANFHEQTLEIYRKIGGLETGLNFFTRNSYFLNRLYFRTKIKHLPEANLSYAYLNEAYHEEAWKLQKQLFENLHGYINERGWSLLVVTFPFVHSLGDYEFRGVHQQLDEFWKSLEVPHLDLLEVFEKYTDKKLVVNKYDAHPNEFAHRIAGEEIYRFIQPEMRTDTNYISK
jgi:hypothetical protein